MFLQHRTSAGIVELPGGDTLWNSESNFCVERGSNFLRLRVISNACVTKLRGGSIPNRGTYRFSLCLHEAHSAPYAMRIGECYVGTKTEGAWNCVFTLICASVRQRRNLSGGSEISPLFLHVPEHWTPPSPPIANLDRKNSRRIYVETGRGKGKKAT